jgi:hypothetical protein
MTSQKLNDYVPAHDNPVTHHQSSIKTNKIIIPKGYSRQMKSRQPFDQAGSSEQQFPSHFFFCPCFTQYG